MARIRVGGGVWRRSRRRLSIHPISTEPADDYFDAGYSEGYSFSSDCDVIDYERRDKVLDDALFGFFRKQAVKSLKRSFSNFCKDMSGTNEVKKNKIDGVDRTVFTRFGPKYFLQVLKKLASEQRAIIEKFGFGCLLLFDCCKFPSDFVGWVADCTDPICSQITIRGKSFDISKETVHVVLGLPIGGLEIRCNSEDGRDFILSHFQLSDMPHITFFGNKLNDPDPLSELDVFVCFMSVVISCFLCPDLKESVNSKYLAVLKDSAAAKVYDFSKLVHDHCLNSMLEFSTFGKSKGRRMKAPVCCNYVPVVRYLDCLDFGIQNVDHTIPRVLVWRGNMIKAFSDLNRKSRHHFGKKQLKEGFADHRLQELGCSAANVKSSTSPRLSPLSSDFRISAHA